MSNFNIYDGLLFTSKPDLGAYGLNKIKSFGPQSRFGDLSKPVVAINETDPANWWHQTLEFLK